VIINPDHAQGMSTSIQAGLRSVPPGTDAVMIVLADQPFVKSQTLRLLSDEYRRTRALAIVPTYNGSRGNPVIFDKSLFPEMMAIRGDIGCRDILRDHAEAVVKVPVDDRGVVIDIDTDKDLIDPSLPTL
jgi:molybdenum cofactor cytidylyltransferase